MSCNVFNYSTNEYLNPLLTEQRGEFGLKVRLLVETDQEEQGLMAELLWSTWC